MPSWSYLLEYVLPHGTQRRVKAFGSWRERARFIAAHPGIKVTRYGREYEGA